MDVITDDAKGGFRRIEVLTGPVRRRRWSAEEKGRVVAETMEPGATVTEIARRWQVCPQQVWGWRREARVGPVALPAIVTAATEPGFVPIRAIASASAASDEKAAPVAAASVKAASAIPSIEIRLAGAVVRVTVGTDCTLLADVLRAVRASAA